MIWVGHWNVYWPIIRSCFWYRLVSWVSYWECLLADYWLVIWVGCWGVYWPTIGWLVGLVIGVFIGRLLAGHLGLSLGVFIDRLLASYLGWLLGFIGRLLASYLGWL